MILIKFKKTSKQISIWLSESVAKSWISACSGMQKAMVFPSTSFVSISIYAKLEFKNIFCGNFINWKRRYANTDDVNNNKYTNLFAQHCLRAQSGHILCIFGYSRLFGFILPSGCFALKGKFKKTDTKKVEFWSGKLRTLNLKRPIRYILFLASVWIPFNRKLIWIFNERYQRICMGHRTYNTVEEMVDKLYFKNKILANEHFSSSKV